MRQAMRSPQHAFSLIELLVVLFIMALLGSMIFVQTESADNSVKVAALQLEATLTKARNLARQSGMAHAVVFHIENYGDGRVLQNFGLNEEETFIGRHWYAIVGPNKGAQPITWGDGGGGMRQYTKNPNMPPLVDPRTGGWYNNSLYNEFLDDVAISQVGPRHYLPEGVRFLALGDYDFGFNIHDTRIWKTTASDSNLLDEFPKPWFGVLKPVSSVPASIRPTNGNFVLYPWGGGDTEWETARSATNHTAFGTLDGQTTNVEVHGPLVDGERIDFCILFQADGSAYPVEHFAARRAFDMLTKDNGFIYQDKDLLHHPFFWNSMQGVNLNDANEAFKNSGIHHQTRLTGGVHITLCRDVDESEEIYSEPGRVDVFDNEEDALKSITPYYRVYVNNFSAATEVRDREHPMALTKMNQRRLIPTDVGETFPIDGVLYRPAYRHSYFADQINASLQDADWTDDPEGWRGWFPDYP